MPLFQQSVLKKYLSGLNKAKLSAAWQLFKAHFHNSDIQQLVYALYGLTDEDIALVEERNARSRSGAKT